MQVFFKKRYGFFLIFIPQNPERQINTGESNKIWDNVNPYDNPEGLTSSVPREVFTYYGHV